MIMLARILRMNATGNYYPTNFIDSKLLIGLKNCIGLLTDFYSGLTGRVTAISLLITLANRS